MAESRVHPSRPVVGVGAVVLEAGRVLLVKRAHEPLRGHWSLPGGAVELGETLHAAIAREVLEETGLIIDVGPVVDVLDRVRRDAGGLVEYHYVLIDFLCRPTGGALAASSDADEAVWACVADLDRFHVADGTVRVIEKGVDLFDRASG